MTEMTHFERLMEEAKMRLAAEKAAKAKREAVITDFIIRDGASPKSG